MAASLAKDPSYTVFIRLPFERGDFVDPPPVDWDAAKDKQLWKILSKASKNSDIDWNALAEKFDVSLPFLLQQAAWLYERQLSQVRAQMRKVGVSKTAPSPVPSDSTGGEAMRRTGSGGGGLSAYIHASKLTPTGPRAPSSLSARKDSPIPKTDTSIPNTPNRMQAPPLSRTSSASTATAMQSRNLLQTSPRPVKAQLHRLSISPPTRAPATLKTKNVSSSDGAESSSSDSSSESEPAQSRLTRRPRFPSNKLGRSEDADDDDEGPAFLPFASAAETPSSHDPSATLRGDPRNIARRQASKKSTEVIQQSQTSDSSNSSTAPARIPPRREISHPQRPSGPLSPRRTAELAGKNPMGRGKSSGREGSDGTPSMGSSFSDLDDASVTQSALEEALASNMQQGGMASRMSTISQALRSRYL